MKKSAKQGLPSLPVLQMQTVARAACMHYTHFIAVPLACDKGGSVGWAVLTAYSCPAFIAGAFVGAKAFAVTTAPRVAHMIYLDCEGGALTLRKQQADANQAKKQREEMDCGCHTSMDLIWLCRPGTMAKEVMFSRARNSGPCRPVQPKSRMT